MRKQWQRMVRVLAGIALFVSAGSVAAQDMPCDATVVDAAGAFGNDVGSVETAVQPLINIGATVRVRTVRTYGSAGSLDHYEAAIERQCASWRAPDGGTRNSLIAVFIAVDDREVGLYSGTQWEHVVRPNWASIQDRQMKPKFRDSDFAGGFVAGLREVHRLIETAERAPVGAVVGSRDTKTIVQTQPTDLSGCANVGYGLLVLVCIILGALIGMNALRFRQRRRAAQAIARDKRHAATSGMLEARGKLAGLKTRTEAAALIVSEADAQRLRGKLEEIERLVGAMALTMSEVEPEGSQDPTRDGRSREEYETVTKGYERAFVQLREIQARQASHDRELDALHQAAKEAPVAITVAEEAISGAENAIDKVRSEGWKTGAADEVIALAQEAFDRAKSERDAKKLAAAAESARAASGLASQAFAITLAIPQRKKTIDGALETLSGRIDRIRGAVAEASAAFDRISAAYAESSWESVAGNGSSAEAFIAEADDALATGRLAATKEQQRWSAADEAVKAGNAAIEQADALLQGIHDREQQLQVAQQIAQQEINEAAADLARAIAYEREHDADIDDAMKGELRAAEQTLGEARDELAKQPPDYLRVVERAKRANAHADRILAQCQNEHEAAERLRRRAVSAFNEAQATVNRARSYIHSHSSDVGPDARGALSSAEQSLSNAERVADPKTSIANAEQAASEAERAYSRARRDVDEVEAARRRTREAAEARRRASYSSTSYGGSHRSGGSSSWGSSSRSGGSSSFGSSRRSGGSSKW